MIEVIARIRRTPFVEHAYQLPAAEMRLDDVFQQVSQAKARGGRIEHWRRPIDDEPSLDPHPHPYPHLCPFFSNSQA